jgi:L-amino acid N-acyltransferase YncA
MGAILACEPDSALTRRPASYARIVTQGAPLQIRPTVDGDRSVVVEMGRELVASADTYAFDSAIDDEELWAYWAPAAPGCGYVAASKNDQIMGAFVIRPNHPGPGSHIANASYVVAQRARGEGVGRAMGERSIEIARGLGYDAMQFNIVISSNVAALRLWQSLGFRIVGTVPEGFARPDGQRVDFHIMHRMLR